MVKPGAFSKSTTLKIAIGAFSLIIIGLLVFAVFVKHIQLSIDSNNLPKIIEASVLDVNQLGAISKFRSSSGHDFSDSSSPCSSMKHYFEAPADIRLRLDGAGSIPQGTPNAITGMAVSSPVTGTIEQIVSEQFPLGKQIYIRSTSAPTFVVRLFHVYLNDSLSRGSRVKAGDQVGYIWRGQTMDVAVEASALTGRHFFSYFEMMSDAVVSEYQKIGLANADQVIISEEARAAAPLQCNGEQFVNSNSSNGGEMYNPEDYFVVTP